MASSTTNDIAALGSLAPLIINMLKGSSQPNPGALLGTIPGGQDILNSVVGQQQQQAPLRQAVTQQAMNMLPNSAFPGGRPALSAVGPGAAPVASSGSGADIGKVLAAGGIGAGLGALLSKLGSSGSGGGGPLGDLLRKLFGKGGPGMQNNLPNSGGALTGPSAFEPSQFMGWQNDPKTSPTASVSTSESYAWPNDVLNDPAFLNALQNGPSDPSNGTGVGPGMQAYYGGDGPGGDAPEPGADWGG